jgi:hypothetical protein
MRTFRNGWVTILGLGLTVCGCASVIKGSSQSIAISTPPTTGASCTLASAQGNWMVISPGVASVEKSKEDIQIRCVKPGWQDAAATIPSNFEGWTVGNLLLGGIIGLGVDAATGAINEYPHTFQIPMTPMSASYAAPATVTASPPVPTTIPAATAPVPLTSAAPAPTAVSTAAPTIGVYPSPAVPMVTPSPATAGQTVLFPVTITNPYRPHWTVGGAQ